MTDLTKTVARVTRKTVHEASRDRQIVVILEPPGQIGFRLKGTRKVFWLSVEGCYQAAVKAEVAATAKPKRKKR